MASNGTVGTAGGKVENSSMTDVRTWLEQVRKLDGALLDHMGVGVRSIPGLGEAAAFAYRKDGKPYAGKFRAVDRKDWRSTQGVSRGLYNEDCLKSETGPVVITEGEIDCLSVMQVGYTRSVSLPDGWNPDGTKRECLIEAEPMLRTSPYVIVAGDNDEAGRSLPKAVANILLGHDVRFVTWPDDCKDANDVLVRHGEAVLGKCLLDAKRIDPEGGFITGISDLPPMPERRVLRMGTSPFDHVLAFEVGAMSVGTGTPGAGKSTFSTFAAYHVAMHENIRVGMLAFETHPYRIRDHLARLKEGKPWGDMNGIEREGCAAFLDRHFRIVHRTFEDRMHNIGWLKDMIYTLAVRDNCKLILVDPWNELEHLPEPGESMTAYINFALQQIRKWAEQFDTHICVIAHPRKMNTEGKPRAPTGYDIADSAAFFNKPSLGFSVHHDETDDGEKFVRVECWKVRDVQLYGFERGSMRLSFAPHTMAYHRFDDPARYRRNDQ
jgi:twinkle protein